MIAGYEVTVVGQDCYYKDLAHHPIEVRAETNFDHPGSLVSNTLLLLLTFDSPTYYLSIDQSNH
jgi:uridine kinase